MGAKKSPEAKPMKSQQEAQIPREKLKETRKT
ncbi:hypothetical protein Dhaf_2728 [Desulfitobacterium hafniense DCB-2]|uniref:Uncharacterized protein n=1 Tax=Desulfitobacterium hafniense (strain DSM 10664 / DCB-2) TaxID=272564 RepID=B8FWE2_DESHD|nr:hypothetical protein Dhaf_2728 [Desulfitobacterium hafniense DCB-2]